MKDRPITGTYTFREKVISPNGSPVRDATMDIRRVKHIGQGRFEIIAERSGVLKKTFILRGATRVREYVDALIDHGFVRS